MVNISQIKKEARGVIKENFPYAVLIAIVPIIYQIANSRIELGYNSETGSFVNSKGSGMDVFLSFVLLILTPVISKLFIQFVKGVKLSFDEVTQNLGDNFPRYLTTSLLTTLYLTGWLLLFFIPGIIKTCSYALVPYILADSDLGNNEAITESRRLMNGHKLAYFTLHLSFLGWEILSLFSFGLLQVWLTPYREASVDLFYNTIKEQEYGVEITEPKEFNAPKPNREVVKPVIKPEIIADEEAHLTLDEEHETNVDDKTE